MTGQFLDQKAEGNADIFCTTGGAACPDDGAGTSAALTSIEMKAGLDPNGIATAWTDAIINMQSGVGTALVTVMDNTGHTFTDILGPGSNFVTMIAGIDPGTGLQEFITDITVVQKPLTTGPFGFEEFKQPRVSGVCELQSATSCTPIPEPTSLALFGTALVGLGLLGRRRNRGSKTGAV